MSVSSVRIMSDTEAEFRAKKAELLAAKAYGVAPPPPPPPQKTKLSLSDATFTAPLTSLGDDAVPSMVDDTVPRFQSRRGLGSKRGWDVRVACDPEDAADVCAVVNAHYAGDFAGPDAFRSGPGPTVTEADVARQLESPDGQWVVVESVVVLVDGREEVEVVHYGRCAALVRSHVAAEAAARHASAAARLALFAPATLETVTVLACLRGREHEACLAVAQQATVGHELDSSINGSKGV